MIANRHCSFRAEGTTDAEAQRNAFVVLRVFALFASGLTVLFTRLRITKKDANADGTACVVLRAFASFAPCFTMLLKELCANRMLVAQIAISRNAQFAQSTRLHFAQ